MFIELMMPQIGNEESKEDIYEDEDVKVVSRTSQQSKSLFKFRSCFDFTITIFTLISFWNISVNVFCLYFQITYINLGYADLLENKEETEILNEKEGKLEACQNDTVKVEVDSQDGEYDQVVNDDDLAARENDQVYEEQENPSDEEQEDNDDVQMTDVDTTVPDIINDTIKQVCL